MQLTPHYTLEEMTKSDTAARHGFDNQPTGPELNNLQATAKKMEVVRGELGVAVVVTSGYRSRAVNTLVGGAPTSAHCKGLACDFTAPAFGTTYEVAMAIYKSNIQFDQLILEYGWVHLSIADDYHCQPWRRECLTKRSAASPYEKGINK